MRRSILKMGPGVKDKAPKRAFTLRMDCGLMQTLWSHEEGFERKL